MNSEALEPQTAKDPSPAEYKTWLCVICGLVYSERDGWPDEGIAPGTSWEDVPNDWVCPDCGAGKADFEMKEIRSDSGAPS